MNVTLIGMPGAGKSLVGKALARALGYRFVDVDGLLEKEYGKSLPIVLRELGEQAFMAAEANAVLGALKGAGGLVLSPGGSVVYSEVVMQQVAAAAHIVYLEIPLAVIEQRIGDEPRGIVGLERATLAELYAERAPLYERYAHLTIDGDQAVEKVVAAITEYLRKQL